MTRTQKITIDSRADFPVTPGERFTVRDGNGHAVELWQHLESATGKQFASHTYAVTGYHPDPATL